MVEVGPCAATTTHSTDLTAITNKSISRNPNQEGPALGATEDRSCPSSADEQQQQPSPLNALPKQQAALDLNVQYFPCKTCGSKFPSYYFVHKHRRLCHGEETQQSSSSSSSSSSSKTVSGKQEPVVGPTTTKSEVSRSSSNGDAKGHSGPDIDAPMNLSQQESENHVSKTESLIVTTSDVTSGSGSSNEATSNVMVVSQV